MAVSIKTQHEIALMRESNHRLEKVFEGLEQMIKPGVSTWEIDMLARQLIREQEGTPNFLTQISSTLKGIRLRSVLL